jgi:hypothetical protein
MIKNDIIVINGRLPTLNQYIAALGKNRYAGGLLKKEATETCYNAFLWQCKNKYNMIDIILNWYEENKKRDKDNIASAKKYILDGMQKAEIIKNDNWNCINSFKDNFYIDKNNPRIEIIIREYGVNIDKI